MIKSSYTTQRGLTLIELLLYISIFTIVLLSLVTFMLEMNDAIHELQIAEDINETARFALERITREVKQADNVHVTGSVLGIATSTLMLNTKDASDNDTVIVFYVDSEGRIVLEHENGDIEILSRSSVEVEQLVFHRFLSLRSQAIRATLQLSATVGDSTKTQTFYGSSVLRGSY